MSYIWCKIRTHNNVSMKYYIEPKERFCWVMFILCLVELAGAEQRPRLHLRQVHVQGGRKLRCTKGMYPQYCSDSCQQLIGVDLAMSNTWLWWLILWSRVNFILWISIDKFYIRVRIGDYLVHWYSPWDLVQLYFTKHDGKTSSKGNCQDSGSFKQKLSCFLFVTFHSELVYP